MIRISSSAKFLMLFKKVPFRLLVYTKEQAFDMYLSIRYPQQYMGICFKVRKPACFQKFFFIHILHVINFYMLLFTINSFLALCVHLPVFSAFQNYMVNDLYIDLKWRLNGLKSYIPSMWRPVWAGLYYIYGITRGMPDFECKLFLSRESLIRALTKVSAKSVLCITNTEKLEILSNRRSRGGHDCFTQLTVAYSRDASKLSLYSECFNLWSCLIPLSSPEMSNDSSPVWGIKE